MILICQYTNMNENKLSIKMLFITPLRFFKAFSMHVFMKPYKRFHLELKRVLLLLQAEEPFSGTV